MKNQKKLLDLVDRMNDQIDVLNGCIEAAKIEYLKENAIPKGTSVEVTRGGLKKKAVIDGSRLIVIEGKKVFIEYSFLEVKRNGRKVPVSWWYYDNIKII